MNGGRGAKGSIKDRIISILYIIRYKKKKLKEESYTVSNKEKQVKYINNLQIFREKENVKALDTKDKKILGNIEYNTKFKISKKNVFEKKIKPKIDYNKHQVNMVYKNLNIKLDSIESKTNELEEKVNLKKEIKKTKEEIIILKEVDKFIKTSIVKLDEIKTGIDEIKSDLKDKNKPSKEIENKYNKLKKKITKLKNQYETIKEKYDLSEFSILESIKLMDSVENYKTIASINEIEMMVKVCKKEIEKIDNITIVHEESKIIENNIESKKDNENKIKVKFNKNKQNINQIKTIEDRLAYELKEQQSIIDDMYDKASYFEKEVTKKIEYIGHRKILSSLLRIAGGILTIPLTGSQIFGVALGSTMINKGLKEMNRTLEKRERMVINYKYEDISKQVEQVKDKIEYTNLVLLDSLNEIKKLKNNFNNVYKDYQFILPDYTSMMDKINDIENKLLEQQSKLIKMDKKLEKEKEMNKQKLKKISIK